MYSWDEYFYEITLKVAKKTHCMSRQIGAILVKDNVIVSTGYNGPPRGVPHCDKRIRWDKLLQERFQQTYSRIPTKLNQCPRKALGYASGEALELCPAAHAEANCIVQAARNGISTKGTTMYMTCGIPCKNCLVLIINAGIREIVCTSLEKYDKLSEFIIQSAGLKIRTFEM